MPQVTFERHRAQVYAWAYRLLQNHHDALDVTQDVFIKWWRAHGQGSAPVNPLGWLRRVTVNQALDAIRSAARKRADPADEAAETVEAPDPAQPELARRIARALNTLTERQRCVVVAKVYDGCTFAQVAEQMDVSVPTVKTHYLRGLKALRHKLPEFRAEDTSAGSSTRRRGCPGRDTGDDHGP